MSRRRPRRSDDGRRRHDAIVWGGELSASAATRASGGNAPRLRLTVVNGDLTFERLPLLIGHYNATKLTGTERVMNTLIGGAMSQALDLGDYPIEPGTHQIFLNRSVVQGKPWLTPRPKAVIVVGLGQEGSLKGADAHTHRASGRDRVGAPRRRRRTRPSREAHEPARPAPLELAATLIGSGGTGIATGQAAQLIAQGVYEANERLAAASSTRDRRVAVRRPSPPRRAVSRSRERSVASPQDARRGHAGTLRTRPSSSNAVPARFRVRSMPAIAAPSTTSSPPRPGSRRAARSRSPMRSTPSGHAPRSGPCRPRAGWCATW